MLIDCLYTHFTSGELRLLAKQNGQNRMLIAEAGAIPHLVDLLYAPDAGTQEHAVTALLNLSIYVDNKERIMASEAVPGILHVLENGSMEARENAAATFSASLGWMRTEWQLVHLEQSKH
ncbi:U-box domain-containing protein 13 [Spatholobus suberectus]|nr:U-box domain-containing protein 13 [Spatholobus suberectus]